MIGRIRGVLVARQAPDILVDVGGIGYEIQVPMTTLYELPGLGAELQLFTHFVAREDSQRLYGFLQQRDRALFRDLIKVNGVGPKLALAILSGMDTPDFVRCVQQDDTSTLMQLPGVGRKTAARLLVEMRDRLKQQLLELDAETPLPAGGPRAITAEAEAALVALGYPSAQASRAVAAVNDDSIDSSEALIRRALQSMVSKR